MNNQTTFITSAIFIVFVATGCTIGNKSLDKKTIDQSKAVPASEFDLSHWKLQVPIDLNHDNKADTIDVTEIETYSNSDYFYLDKQNRMVFASPNKAATSKTSTNTRSELRYMSRGENTAVATSAPGNNFALASHKNSTEFASIGGKMEASLHVDHVSKNAGNPEKNSAYSVVVGQIHALKLKEKIDGFGYGNEPLKIFYKKWPEHETGSVFWTYERNLPTDDPNRIDIAYAVWGNSWDNTDAPNNRGIALGEEFSYTVNVFHNTMYLTFKNIKQGEVHFEINLANNINANGEIDSDDHPLGYASEPLYFKAGVYNQCSTKVSTSFRYPGCPGTGNWPIDFSNGNYAKATFSKLKVSSATPK